MRFKVSHSTAGRIRVRVNPAVLQLYQHNLIAQALSGVTGIRSVEINPRTGSILIYYKESIIGETQLLLLLGELPLEEFPLRKEPKEKSIVWSYIGYQISRMLQPYSLRPLFTVWGSIPFFKRGLISIINGRFDVDLLDASAIGASMVQNDYKSASTLIMLLKTGEFLEEWAKQRTKQSLADSMSMNVGHVWIKKNGTEECIPYSNLKLGDLVIVRMGIMVPVDGIIDSGEAMINEASLTGEPLPVAKQRGDTAHAGTVVEEGEIIVKVLQKGNETRYQKIIQLIQESEDKKANIETKANSIADKMVPFSFAIAGLTYAITRNPMKASAALSVDYSCAIKLSTPLVFLSAMKEALNHGIFFKGGATIEKLSKIDTIVFDKTGTLTHATPKIIKIIPYNGYDENEVLKIAACLEEHFPHPVAKAVVNYSTSLNILHKEEHNEVKYIVAHGIATEYKGEHTVIGSRHFIVDDEKIDISVATDDEKSAADNGYSVLYLGRNHCLAGIILIDDPVREEAREVIKMLRCLGVHYVYMLTGDNKHTAQRVATELGIGSFKGEVLPHDKAEAVKLLKSKGRNVLVVGDGLNDSPAMAVADIGIAMKGGADLAQEVADITLNEDSLYLIVLAKMLADRAMSRIHKNNISAIGINSILMFLGIFGNIGTALSVWLHNLTTLGISLNSTRNLLPNKRTI